MKDSQRRAYKKYNSSEKKRELDKRYRQTEKYRTSQIAYRKKNKEKIEERRKVRSQTEAGKKLSRKYNAKRRASGKANQRYNERYATDINFRIKATLRARMNIAVHIKHARTLTLIGCNIQTLRTYLEQQFKEGMTWNNYGQWHIDHIKPCAKFDLTNLEEQKICFHYTNLQPLWAVDNIKKGAQYG